MFHALIVFRETAVSRECIETFRKFCPLYKSAMPRCIIVFLLGFFTFMNTVDSICFCCAALRHKIVNTLYFIHLVVSIDITFDLVIIFLNLIRKASVHVSQRLPITQFDDVGRILLQQYVVTIDFTNIK